MQRRHFLQGFASIVSANILQPVLAVDSNETVLEFRERARRILASTPAFDLHTHPGMFALKDIPNSVNPRKYFGDAKVTSRVAEMNTGQLACGFVATVSDAPILRPPRKAGESFEGREWKPDESWQEYRRQKAVLDRIVTEHDLVKALSAKHIRNAHRSNKPAIVYDCEGADHLEGKPERLQELYADGIRVLQPLHVAENGLGDIANGPARHGGLSAIGKEVVREMNRLHMLIDMAHASEEATVQAATISTQPIISSHDLLEWRENPKRNWMAPRHARAVIETGGIIGAFPGAVNGDFETYIDNIINLIEFAGIDHVAIGTDMDGNIHPVVDDYNDYPKIASHLLARDLNDDEVAKVMGGNALRVFELVVG